MVTEQQLKAFLSNITIQMIPMSSFKSAYNVSVQNNTWESTGVELISPYAIELPYIVSLYSAQAL